MLPLPKWVAILIAVGTWVALTNSIRVALTVNGGVSSHHTWADVVVIGSSIYSVGSLWLLWTNRLPKSPPELQRYVVSMLLYALAVAPCVVGVAGVFLGAGFWVIWLTTLPMAAGLVAWAIHAQRG